MFTEDKDSNITRCHVTASEVAIHCFYFLMTFRRPLYGENFGTTKLNSIHCPTFFELGEASMLSQFWYKRHTKNSAKSHYHLPLTTSSSLSLNACFCWRTRSGDDFLLLVRNFLFRFSGSSSSSSLLVVDAVSDGAAE